MVDGLLANLGIGIVSRFCSSLLAGQQRLQISEFQSQGSGDSVWKPAAKARPKQTSMPMPYFSRVTIPFHVREWIEVEAGEWPKLFLNVWLTQFASSPHWSIRTWLSYMQRGGGPKKRFRYCLNPHSAETIIYFRAIQGHPGQEQINPTLQYNVLLPSDFAEYIYHVGSSHDMHSIIQSGLIPGGKDIKKGRQTVFFTAVSPMSIHLHKQRDYDVTKPRIEVHKQNWKIHQNTVYWTNLRLLRRRDWRTIKPDLTRSSEALKADLRQNYAYSPCSKKSQDVIRSMGISPKIQCSHCPTYWTKGIVCCTCGPCLRRTDKTRKLNRDRCDALSIPNYVIKKGPSHGVRHGILRDKILKENEFSRSSRRGQKGK